MEARNPCRRAVKEARRKNLPRTASTLRASDIDTASKTSPPAASTKNPFPPTAARPEQRFDCEAGDRPPPSSPSQAPTVAATKARRQSNPSPAQTGPAHRLDSRTPPSPYPGACRGTALQQAETEPRHRARVSRRNTDTPSALADHRRRRGLAPARTEHRHPDQREEETYEQPLPSMALHPGTRVLLHSSPHAPRNFFFTRPVASGPSIRQRSGRGSPRLPRSATWGPSRACVRAAAPRPATRPGTGQPPGRCGASASAISLTWPSPAWSRCSRSGVRKRRRASARAAGRAAHAQPRLDEGPQQPRPDRALVIGAVALERTALVARL